MPCEYNPSVSGHEGLVVRFSCTSRRTPRCFGGANRQVGAQRMVKLRRLVRHRLSASQRRLPVIRSEGLTSRRGAHFFLLPFRSGLLEHLRFTSLSCGLTGISWITPWPVGPWPPLPGRGFGGAKLLEVAGRPLSGA